MDNAVIEETKNKLINYRIIEQQIEQKTAEVKMISWRSNKSILKIG